jgi:hypothetical protein
VFESLFDLKYFLFFIFDRKMIEKHKKKLILNKIKYLKFLENVFPKRWPSLFEARHKIKQPSNV